MVGSTAFSPSFRECTKSQGEQYGGAEQSSLENQVGTIIFCEAAFADANNGAITAIATVFVAIFTLTLWIVTGRSVQLARNEFIATHRPKIIVRHVLLADHGDELAQRDAQVDFVIANVGDTDATITRFYVQLYIQGELNPFFPRSPEFRRSDVNLRIAPGESVAVRRECDGKAAEWSTQIIDASGAAFIVGRIKYVGDDRIQREMGFCRQMDGRNVFWGSIENPEFEYN